MTINQCAVCGYVDTTGTLQICPKCKSPMPNQKGRKIKPPKSQPSAAQQPTGYPARPSPAAPKSPSVSSPVWPSALLRWPSRHSLW